MHQCRRLSSSTSGTAGLAGLVSPGCVVARTGVAGFILSATAQRRPIPHKGQRRRRRYGQAVDRIAWDAEKDRLNQGKHGVSFAEATVVLNHPLTRTRPDVEHSFDEPREISIGPAPAGQVLVIVTALAVDGSIRIISARRAMKRERHAYEGD